MEFFSFSFFSPIYLYNLYSDDIQFYKHKFKHNPWLYFMVRTICIMATLSCKHLRCRQRASQHHGKNRHRHERVLQVQLVHKRDPKDEKSKTKDVADRRPPAYLLQGQALHGAQAVSVGRCVQLRRISLLEYVVNEIGFARARFCAMDSTEHVAGNDRLQINLDELWSVRIFVFVVMRFLWEGKVR